VSWPPAELLAAIALQALNTEWIYQETRDERARLAGLQATLLDPDARVTRGVPSRALWVYSLYRSLDPFREDRALVSMARECQFGLAELMRRHLLDPPRERALCAAMPRLTMITNDVSTRVRTQYEERPYPSWRTLPRRAARPVGEVLAAALEDAALGRSISIVAPQVLVAGCGTGRHAIATATRFTGAQVLAVDLSLTSLGYAARQAERLGVGNIAFAQADIMDLADLPERFDVIECTGVLHHLANPEAGWQVLRGLLKPRGLMRIALYSERGRAAIDQVRALISERGFEPTPDGVRATRAAVRALPDNAPARRITASPDFYALSGCRDLFFPTHEDRFSPPRISRALERLRLHFLGFEFTDHRVRQLYRQRFPQDPAARSLANWDRLEAEFPSLFAAMYQLWCRASD
jgi:2-polyprenyl-3-methyl-5-hydroxy-6-metoxy-1,4-benzoquinol methylase